MVALSFDDKFFYFIYFIRFWDISPETHSALKSHEYPVTR